MLPDRNVVVVMTGGGFEPGDIGRYLANRFAQDAALPVDPANQTRLAASSARDRQPAPERRARSRPGPNGEACFGTCLRARHERRGHPLLRVDFVDRDISVLHLGLTNGGELVQPLGMDGRYRLTSVDGGALSGWTSSGGSTTGGYGWSSTIEPDQSIRNRCGIRRSGRARGGRGAYELGTVGAVGVAKE